MSELDFEMRILSMANEMKYPRTPDIAASVMTRLFTSPRSRFNSRAVAWSLIIILVLCSSLMLIPTARAAILDFIQIGVVRIFPRSTQPAIQQVVTATSVSSTPVPLPSPSPTPEALLPILQQMTGETTLAEAQSKTKFPILLPTYPTDLGQPDHVFVQNTNGNMAILVWMIPGHSDQVRLSLQIIPSGSWVLSKFEPLVVRETSVNGHHAIWTMGPYPLLMRNGNIEVTRLVSGHVLIWTDGDVTYRLETDLTLEETVKIAESLAPIP